MKTNKIYTHIMRILFVVMVLSMASILLACPTEAPKADGGGSSGGSGGDGGSGGGGGGDQFKDIGGDGSGGNFGEGKCPETTGVVPTLVDVTTLQGLINDAKTAQGTNSPNLNHIDISKMTNLLNLFKNNATFNGDVSCWDTSSVTKMQGVFEGASAFNGNVSGWDTSKVALMLQMFWKAAAFTQDISKWNVAKVTNHNFFANNSGIASDTTKQPSWN